MKTLADELAQVNVPHDFNRCRCDQWGRCLVHCPTCDCAAAAVPPAAGDLCPMDLVFGPDDVHSCTLARGHEPPCAWGPPHPASDEVHVLPAAGDPPVNDTSRHDPDSLAGRLKTSLETAASRHDKPALPADAVRLAAEAICDYWHDPDECPCTEAATAALEAAYEAIRDQATAAERARLLAELREFLNAYVGMVVHSRTLDGEPIYASGPVAFGDALVDTFALMSTPDADL